MSTLLQKAKESGNRKNAVKITDEIAELALGWCNDEITLSQVQRALGLKGASVQTYLYVAHALKYYIKQQKQVQKSDE